METLNSVYAPYIGANGNWYVDNEDTGVKARGPIGHQGPVGPQGEIGPMGETGDRGPQGLTGDTGATGSQGPQGEKGDKGDKGDTGPQGEIGLTPSLAENLTTVVPGEALDATMGKVLDDKIKDLNNGLKNKADIRPVKHTSVQSFNHGITGSVSLIKYGSIVIVTASLLTPIVIKNETILFSDNSINATFGFPEHDYHCCLSHFVNDIPDGTVGTMSIKPDTGLRISFPAVGQYRGVLVYCVK